MYISVRRSGLETAAWFTLSGLPSFTWVVTRARRRSPSAMSAIMRLASDRERARALGVILAWKTLNDLAIGSSFFLNLCKMFFKKAVSLANELLVPAIVSTLLAAQE